MGEKVGRKRNNTEDLLWYSRATKVLKGEMLRLGVSTTELRQKLGQIGVDIEQDALSKKVHRGGFSFAFFLQCMQALGVSKINLYMALEGIDTVARFEPNTREPHTTEDSVPSVSRFAPELGTRSGGKPKLIDDEIPPYRRPEPLKDSEQ
jgi:hypothetical protein